ncbi:prefoldin subunit 1, component of a chaperone [Scheffersomyces xylosifermentans]|uniref:prefoldin subunit 1, component of a chaperone n=1 Tax=Scheffersomyces xylosifermentans TaxID=1304137 RepID=UPI00315C842D
MDQQALQKLLIDMDNQLNKSRAELSMVNLQIDRVDTNLNLIKTTTKSLNKHCQPTETVWQGVGKAFVAEEAGEYLKKIGADEKSFLDSKKNLSIKKDYLETTLQKTLEGMQQIVGKKN